MGHKQVIKGIEARATQTCAPVHYLTAIKMHYMHVNDGSDLILPESFLSEAGLSLLPHLSILLESYTSAKVNF